MQLCFLGGVPETNRPNVKVREFDDFDTLRDNILETARHEITKAFPQSQNGLRVELADVDYQDREPYSLEEQKHALLHDKFLAKRLKGKLRLVDETTNEVIEEKPMTLMRVPWLTPRGTFIHGGNEYTTITQMRLMPGVYSRRQANGLLETQFNVKPGTGTNFRVGFDPATARFNLKVQQAQLHLYSLLKDLGVDDAALEKSWGKGVLEANRARYDARVLPKAYARLVPRFQQDPAATREQMAAAVSEALSASRVSSMVLSRNLPGVPKAASVTDGTLPEFSPDLTPAATAAAVMEDFLIETTKQADSLRSVVPYDDGFEPDLDPDDIREDTNRVYGSSRKPQLASMKKWPAHWLTDQDPMGWLQWYEAYASGRRSPDDAWQIERWRRFKARNGASFKRNPTPRRAFALRNWAIDPIKLLDDEEARDRVRADMEAYRAAVDAKATSPYRKAANATPTKFGCLMAQLNMHDAARVLTRNEALIPEADLGAEGREHDVHVTVLYGFPDREGILDEIDAVIRKELGRDKIRIRLGAVSRFTGKDGRDDVIKVDVESPQLRALNAALRAIPGVTVTYPTYTPHLTLAYVKSGKLPELDGNACFSGETYVFDSLVFSHPHGTRKETIEWGSDKSASLRREELVALARMLNATLDANLDETLPLVELEAALLRFMNDQGYLAEPTPIGDQVQPLRLGSSSP